MKVGAFFLLLVMLTSSGKLKKIDTWQSPPGCAAIRLRPLSSMHISL